jgi:hypothetical protein
MSTEFALQVVVIFPKILGIRVERNLIVFAVFQLPAMLVDKNAQLVKFGRELFHLAFRPLYAFYVFDFNEA